MTSAPAQNRILFFTSSLAGGGAEKHLVRLLPLLSKHFDITLGLSRQEGPLLNEIPSNLRCVEFGGKRTLFSLPFLLQFVLKQKPDVIVSLQDHANAVALLCSRLLPVAKRPKVICCIQNNIKKEAQAAERFRARSLYALLPHLYPKATKIIASSKGLENELISWIPRLQQNTTTIHNCGFDTTLQSQKDEPFNEPWLREQIIPTIISCGRLVPQKNFPLLLRAFRRLLSELSVRLIIMGDGPERPHLKRLIREHELGRFVKLLPFQSNPYAMINKASLFVLPSNWEGFGNVLVEAMVCGVPVISTDCPFGPNEIIEHEKSGLLVPPQDEVSLCKAMSLLLNHPDYARSLSLEAFRRAQDFSARMIASSYRDILQEVLSQ